MKHKALTILAAVALGAATTAKTQAQSAIPDLMTYQGYVTDDSNVPLGDGTPTNYNVTFRLYGAATGGTPVWAENQVVTIFNGNFSVLLGNGTPDGGTPHDPLDQVFTDDERYLGITVDTGGAPTEFAPRQRILTNAYAYRAKVAESVTGALNTAAGGNVGIGTAAPATELHVNGTITVNPGTLDDPSNGATGGNGERIILWPGSGNQPSYAIGLDTSTLWNSVPSTAGYAWFSGSEEIMTLSKDGRLGIGVTNPVNPLDVRQSGGGLAVWRNSAGLDTWFTHLSAGDEFRHLSRLGQGLRVSQSGSLTLGGNHVSDQLKLAVRGKMAFESNSTSPPAVGTYGPDGTRLVIEPGSASTVPYALGHDTDTLWYSSQKTHAWYTDTTRRMSLDNVGLLQVIPANGFTGLHIQANNNSSVWDFVIEDTTASGTAFDRGGIRMHAGYLHISSSVSGVHSAGAQGYARLNGNGAWTAVSDARLKKDIKHAGGLLEAALNITPVSYKFKSAGPSDARTQIGFTAQDVEKAVPSLVEDDGETKTLNYAGLSTVAIGAIQEQHTLIESQAEKIESLESENEQLKKRLERIEAALELE